LFTVWINVAIESPLFVSPL
jgi:hypothetical protein